MYKSGFATSQEAYTKAVTKVFEALDQLEKMLSGREYLIGDHLTEADVRLFVTIVSFRELLCGIMRIVAAGFDASFQVRFDPVYVGHFKCNKTTIRYGYPELNR